MPFLPGTKETLMCSVEAFQNKDTKESKFASRERNREGWYDNEIITFRTVLPIFRI